MPPVLTASAATEVAAAFLKGHYTFLRPLKASREGSRWLVEIDVDPFRPRVVKLIVDAETGGIVTFDIPPGAGS